MKCKKCGEEITEGHEICLNCGSAVDFEPVDDDVEQEEQIKAIVKKKPVQRLSRQMLAGVVLFIIACLCVGICISYANDALMMYSDDPTRLKTTESTTAQSDTKSPAPLTTEPATFKPYSAMVQNENRKFPLKISACSIKLDKANVPVMSVRVENISDYDIDTYTVKIASYASDGNRIYKNSSDNGGFVEMKYKKSLGVIKSGKLSEIIKAPMLGFEKGVIFKVGISYAHSTDGYKYELSEDKTLWKKVTISQD